jgi:diadenosine tetraphosphatase ApaH/serine/threonine PP2A family protein phosphatase
MRALLQSPAEDRVRRERRIEFVASRPRSHLEDDVLFVHGSPRNPLYEYVFPEDIYNPRKMGRLFELFKGSCFAGHTHVPGIFTEDPADPDGFYSFHTPAEVGPVYRLDGRKTLCNVGSVGQPRDGDWRACYVLFDGREIRFRRVEYDVGATVKKIYANPELENFLGDRLREGH